MKKNDKNVSKTAATMMRKLDKQELDQAAGGLVLRKPCLTCGLINTNI